MVRWFRLFGNQYVGFWLWGLVLFALQEVPYMIMPLLRLDSNPIMTMQESSAALNVCEKIAGSLCIVCMTFLVQENMDAFSVGSGASRAGFIGAAMVLILNYIGWLLYMNGRQSIAVMMFFIVLLPPLYYVFIGLWRQNGALLLVGIIFEVIHFTHVWGNLKM